MDFMNLNQSAHGDREFGYMATRLGMNRKVVVGYSQEEEVQARIGAWSRAAAAWSDSQRLKVARFGDNMREVAVTEGDKVEAILAARFYRRCSSRLGSPLDSGRRTWRRGWASSHNRSNGTKPAIIRTASFAPSS